MLKALRHFGDPEVPVAGAAPCVGTQSFTKIAWWLALTRYVLIQHHLSAGDGDGLTGFILLFDHVFDGLADVFGQASATHGNLGLVKGSNVLDGLGSGNLVASQILHEQSVFRIRPEGAVKGIKRYSSIPTGLLLDAIRMCVIKYAKYKCSNYSDILFHDAFSLAACIDLLPHHQNIWLQSHSPEKPSEEFRHIHTSQLEEIHWIEKMERVAFKRANILLFPNEGSTRPYKDLIGDSKCIEYIASGCQKMPKVNPVPLAENLYYFFYIGRQNHIKGFDIVIDAFRHASKQRDDLHLFIAGNGSRFDDKNITCLGRIDKPEVWLSSVDYMLNLNRKSYFDLSIMEALSVGTPIVMSHTDGHADLKGRSRGIISLEHADIQSLVAFFVGDLTKREANQLASRDNQKLFSSVYDSECYRNRFQHLVDNKLNSK